MTIFASIMDQEGNIFFQGVPPMGYVSRHLHYGVRTADINNSINFK